MILYVPKPFTGINMQNVILFDDTESDNLIYVGLETYEQALHISTRFDGDYASAWKHCAGGNLSKEDGAYSWAVKWKKTVPEPLNYLAFAFQYIKNAKGIDWATFSREDMFGYMHELSMMVDFNLCTLAPVEVRTSVSIPSSILKSYKKSWDEFTRSLADTVLVNNNSADSLKIGDMTVGQLKEILSSISFAAPAATMSSTKTKDSSSSISTKPSASKSTYKKVAEEVEVEELEEDEDGDDDDFDLQAEMDKIDELTAKSMNMSLEDYRKLVAGEPTTPKPDKKPDVKVVPTTQQAPTPMPPKAISKPVSTPPAKDGGQTINGIPVATYDAQKAADTKDVLTSFGDV